MTSVENLNAATYSSSDVLPFVRKPSPHVRLPFVGRIASPDRARLWALDGVDVTGEAASIPESLNGCAVGACPPPLGAGVRHKVRAYIALGLPVVRTSAGLEGLAALPDVDLLVADTAAEFARTVLDLDINLPRATVMAESARRYVEAAHAWRSRLAPTTRAIRESLAARGVRDAQERRRPSQWALAS